MNTKIQVLVCLLMLSGFCFAQKSSSKTLTLEYTIEPTVPKTEKSITYFSLLKTPLDPLSSEETYLAEKEKNLEGAKRQKIEDHTKNYLDVKGASREASGNWAVVVETGDFNVVSTSDKPLNELGWEDAVFTYTCPTKLTVSDKSGTIILEKSFAGPGDEQKMPKALMFMNPIARARMNMAKNNPEKLKKISDQMLEKKSYLVLESLLMRADKEIADGLEVQVKTVNVTVFSVKGKAYGELNDLSEKIFDTYGKFVALSKKNRIPKEDMDKVFLDAIPVWEKYAAEHTELEEQAKKGLILNCALAATFVGDYDKAATYFTQVPEAKIAGAPAEEEESPSSGSIGATVFLTFNQSAENLRSLYEGMKQYGPRAKIRQ